MIDSDDFIIFIHDGNQPVPFESVRFSKGDKEYEYTIYYYSTTFHYLIENLWTWENTNFNFTIPNNPIYPFDQLNKALRENVGIEEAKSAVVEWVIKKKGSINILEAALMFLHECLNTKPIDSRKNEKLLMLTKVGIDLYANCTSGKAKDFNIIKLIDRFNEKPKDTEVLEALRDGILEMSGVK